MATTTAANSLSGVGSGIDTTSLISGLVNADSGPINALKTKQTSTQSAISTLSDISSTLGTLQSAVDALSTASGVYTEAQATEGAALYTSACSICHGASLMGTFEVPTLVGRFVHNWSNGSVGTLFDYVSRAMPQMAPGSLSPAAPSFTCRWHVVQAHTPPHAWSRKIP